MKVKTAVKRVEQVPQTLWQPALHLLAASAHCQWRVFQLLKTVDTK